MDGDIETFPTLASALEVRGSSASAAAKPRRRGDDDLDLDRNPRRRPAAALEACAGGLGASAAAAAAANEEPSHEGEGHEHEEGPTAKKRRDSARASAQKIGQQRVRQRGPAAAGDIETLPTLASALEVRDSSASAAAFDDEKKPLPKRRRGTAPATETMRPQLAHLVQHADQEDKKKTKRKTAPAPPLASRRRCSETRAPVSVALDIMSSEDDCAFACDDAALFVDPCWG